MPGLLIFGAKIMAKNFVQHGNTVTCVAPAGGVISGQLYLIGSLLVVAAITVAAGEEFEGHTQGVWAFNNKVSANTPAVFDKAYLTADGASITTTATSNTLIGVFMEAGVNASTACVVRLNGVSV